ncbi:MAG: rod shape-determining protein MreD [Clostridia bacterium]|nr:rod shape-determining protein MreD [Clostridia bacterium]
MKKLIINISLILTFILIYLLHQNLFYNFTIAGVMPNLFVILILFIGLFFNKTAGITYGAIFGLLLDFFIGKKIGISSVMLGIVGLIGGLFDKNFSKESRITLMIMVIVCTFIFEIGSYTLGFFIYQYEINLPVFIKTLLIEASYNVILTIVLYPLMQNFGYKIEEEYKGNKILTRYF